MMPLIFSKEEQPQIIRKIGGAIARIFSSLGWGNCAHCNMCASCHRKP